MPTDQNNQLATQNINRTDVKPTVFWLENLVNLPLMDNIAGIDSQTIVCKCINIIVDSTTTSDSMFFKTLTDYVASQGQKPEKWLKKTQNLVQFRTPIAGRRGTGFVETNFLFTEFPDFIRMFLTQDLESVYKLSTRNLLLNSIADSLGYKFKTSAGLQNIQDEQTISTDPDEIAKILLNADASADNLKSVEIILKSLDNDSKKHKKIEKFLEYARQRGIAIDDVMAESEYSAVAKLRNRLVNLGMQVIIEHENT